MGDPDRYRIDPDELDEIISRLTRCEDSLELLTDDLKRHVRALQRTWDGLAAEAQQEAHEEWSRGMRAMREALTDLRLAARVAHRNYTAAIAANQSMWRQTR